MRTAGWRIIWQKIMAVIDPTFAVAKRKPEMNFFRLSFRNCKSCVYNCDNPLSSLSYKYSAFYKHLVHIKPLIQVLLKTWRTEFCRELLSPSRFFCFHFITYKKTYPTEKNCSSDLDDAPSRRLLCCFTKKKHSCFVIYIHVFENCKTYLCISFIYYCRCCILLRWELVYSKSLQVVLCFQESAFPAKISFPYD